MRSLLCFLCVLSLYSCGYHFSNSEESISVTIPYIKGDKDGKMTKYLIQALSQSGLVQYSNEEAHYQISGVIKSRSNTTLGYEYRKQNNDTQIQKRLVPDEGRTIVVLEITLTNASTGEKIAGPFSYEASNDYDFVNSESFSEVAFYLNNAVEPTLDYSLGQLDSKEGASLSSMDPTYRFLAHKVALSLLKFLTLNTKK